MHNVNYTCPRCGAPMSPGDKFCGECGADFIEELSRFCPNCHVEIRPGKKYCYNCGTRYLSKAGFFRRYIAYLEGDPEVKAEYDNLRNNDDYNSRYTDNNQYQESGTSSEELYTQDSDSLPDSSGNNSYSQTPRWQNNDPYVEPSYGQNDSGFEQGTTEVKLNNENRPAPQYQQKSVTTSTLRTAPVPEEPFNYEQCQHVRDLFNGQENNGFGYMPEPSRPDFIKPREDLSARNVTDLTSGFNTENEPNKVAPQVEDINQNADNKEKDTDNQFVAQYYRTEVTPEQVQQTPPESTIAESLKADDNTESSTITKTKTEVNAEQESKEFSSPQSEQVKQVNSLFSNQNSSQFGSGIGNQKTPLFAQVSSEINENPSESAGLSENSERQHTEKNDFVHYSFASTSNPDDIAEEKESAVSAAEKDADLPDSELKGMSEQTVKSDKPSVHDGDSDKEQKREEAIKQKLNRDNYQENSHVICKSLLMIAGIMLTAAASLTFYLVNEVTGGSIADEDISYLKDKCSSGDKVSCRYLSEQYAKKAGLSNDYGKKAYFLAVETCNMLDDAASCELAGDMLISGKVVTKDIKKAHKYYAYSCALLSESACEKDKEQTQENTSFVDNLENMIRSLLKNYFYEEQVRISFVKGLNYVVSSYDMDLTEKGLNYLYKGNYKVSASIFIDEDNQRKVRITNIYDRFSNVFDAYIPQMYRNCTKSSSSKEGCRMDGTEEYAIGQHDFNNDGVDEIVIAQINHSSSNSSGTGAIVFDVTSNKYQSFGTPDVASDGQIIIEDNTISMLSSDGKTGCTWKYENDFFNRYPLKR